MKSFKILIPILLFALMKVDAQEQYLMPNETPAKILKYIGATFPTYKILSIQKETEDQKTEYEVKLEPETKLEFNDRYQIKKVKSKAGVPAEVFSPKVLKYIVTNYPGKRAVEWERKINSQEVEMVDGTEIYFDKKGRFLRLGD